MQWQHRLHAKPSANSIRYYSTLQTGTNTLTPFSNSALQATVFTNLGNRYRIGTVLSPTAVNNTITPPVVVTIIISSLIITFVP